jgi:hypothetical protein
MVSGLLMELEDHNCWTTAEAAGHRGPYRLQHLLSRAVWDDQHVTDIASAWAVSHLDDGDRVLFATKRSWLPPCWNAGHSCGIRAAFVADDEVRSGRELRRGIRQRGIGYMKAVRANHALTTGSGRTVTAAAAASLIPVRAWHRMRSGQGPRAPVTTTGRCWK